MHVIPHILDKDLNLCPIGVPGEIYVSGPGIANGYINNISATEASFIILLALFFIAKMNMFIYNKKNIIKQIFCLIKLEL